MVSYGYRWVDNGIHRDNTVCAGGGMVPPPKKEEADMAAGPVLVTVPSESNPSKSYEIRLGHDGNVYCSCPSWKFMKVHPHLRSCKHMKKLSKEIGEAAAKLKGGTKVAAPAPKAAPVAAPAPAAVVAVETDTEAEVVALEKALAEKKAALAAKKAAAEAAAKKAAAAKKVAELKAALAAAEAELAA
jgi:hypothetical protein